MGGATVRISPETLVNQAEATGFRPDMLEKVGLLLQLLDAVRSHPFLKDKLVLKGGTALNLFIFDIPRLSIDIDLNYVGAADREAMLKERPKVEEALQAVFSREGFSVRRVPAEHAGGKWQLRYPSAGGQGGNLEVDVNFMFRIPLWPVKNMNSRPVGIWQAVGIQIVDIHELAAGKLSALLSRRQARDLFDCSNIFHLDGLDLECLRLAFIVYGAMSRKDWRTVTPNDVDFDIADLEQRLIPTLRAAGIERLPQNHFGKGLVEDCRNLLAALLPFTEAEMEFLNRVLDKGEIEPELLTDDVDLQNRIKKHPLLEWKAVNVREFKNKQ
ncbi:MAG TPA: nucleotidyl transferase AbiEii/AbiGii toxin family protein [Syntrophus sp. (in: bacteria)]|nr:nucleotidyl transferase AbiEii/AbiGii toxin family protein [Syntrophus sp. (in: bacteria)]